MNQVGITEAADAAYSKDWNKWCLSDHKPTILITKNPIKLLTDYPGILNQPNIILHITITGYGGTFIEPNAPKAKDCVKYLKTIIHKEKVVIRIDPIIPINEFVSQSIKVYESLKSLFERFRVSVLDLYPHILQRLEPYHSLRHELKQIYDWDLAHSGGEHKDYMVHCNLDRRKRIIDQFSNCEVCAEPGISCTGCISRKDLELMNIMPEKRYNKNNQREFCQCLGIKKELIKSHICPVECLYCYWLKTADKIKL